LQNNQVLIPPPLRRATNSGPEDPNAMRMLSQFIESAAIVQPNKVNRITELGFDRFKVLTLPHGDG
jgi:hypothetical protein